MDDWKATGSFEAGAIGETRVLEDGLEGGEMETGNLTGGCGTGSGEEVRPKANLGPWRGS